MDFRRKEGNSPRWKRIIRRPNDSDSDTTDSDGDRPERVKCWIEMVHSGLGETESRLGKACGSPQSSRESKRVRFHDPPSMMYWSNEHSDPGIPGPSVSLGPSFSSQSKSVLTCPFQSHCTRADEVLQDNEDVEIITFMGQQTPPPRDSTCSRPPGCSSSTTTHPMNIQTVTASTSTEEQPENAKSEIEEGNVQENLEEVIDVENEDHPPETDSGIEQASVALQKDCELNKSIMGLLECPVCFEYMVPPIYQCRRGHLLCYACKPRLFHCPTCRSRLTDTRNLVMEKVAEKLNYPCKNHMFGCVGTFKIKDKPTHEDNCTYRSFRCIVSECEWRGLVTDIINHYAEVHRGVVLFEEQHNLFVNLNDVTTYNYNWMVKAFEEIFRVHFFINAHRSQLYGCVQYIGPRRNAANFSYTFKISNHDQAVVQKRCLVFQRTAHSDLDKTRQIYQSGDCLFVRSDLANLLSDEVNILHCELTLNRNDE